jgi:hypothetical protein
LSISSREHGRDFREAIYQKRSKAMNEAPWFLSKNIDMIAYHDLDGRPGFKMGIQVVEGRWYMYLAHFWDRGWTIMDITDPSKPELVKFIPGPANTWTVQIQVADGKMITALERVGDGFDSRLEAWGHDPKIPYQEGILIWDVSNPVDPKKIGAFKTGGYGTHRNHYPGGKYAYLAANMKGYKGNIFVILDVSDPTQPKEVSRWWVKGQWVEGGETSDTFYQLHGPYVEGDRAYLPYGRAGFIILDISDIAHPRQVSRIDIGDFGSIVGGHTYMPIPARKLAIATTEAIFEEERDPLNLVLVVDISNEERPKPIANFPVPIPPEELQVADFHELGGKFGPHNIHMPHQNPHFADVNDIIHICYESGGFWIYDIKAPGVPKSIAYFIPDAPRERKGFLPNQLATQTEDVVVDSRGYIYITDKTHGLFILRHAP